MKSDINESFRKTSCGCPMMIKTKNQTHEQTNKQTNKQNNFLDLIYLSQIKSDLHEMLRETSCGYYTMIKAKNKQIYKQKTNKQINIFLDPIYLR